MNRDELVACYKAHPPLAAKKVHEHQLRALQCVDRGELDDAVAHWDRADDYHHVLDTLVCCRRCGRPLTHPVSVARKIGPECWEKPPIDGCPICGGRGLMAVPDPVLGDYVDVNCFCAERVRSDNGTSGKQPDPAAPTNQRLP